MNYSKKYRPMENHFYKIGNCFWELPISSSAKVVLGFLRSQHYGYGYNYSLRHIAKRIKLSVQAVRRAIAELEEMKLIKVKKVKGKHNDFYFPPDDYWAELTQPYESVEDICEEYIEDETVTEFEQTVPADDTHNEMDCETFKPQVCNDGGNNVLHTELYSEQNCDTLLHPYKTNKTNKTKDKTNKSIGRDESRQTSRKKFSFEDWHMEIATMWHGHFKRMSPYMADQNLEKWANEIRLTAKQFSLTHEMFRAVFEFVEGDQFWCNNADSPMSLRRKNKSDIPKITNILKAMPEYNRQRKAHETANGFLTREQARTRAILKEIGF